MVFVTLILLSCSGARTPALIVDKTVTLKNEFTEPKINSEGFYDILNFSKTEAFLDLDTGMIIPNLMADLYYFYDCGSMCMNNIHVIESEKSRKIGSEEPGYLGCFEVLVEPGGDGIAFSIIEENYSCILTNDGRLSQIYIKEYNSWGENGELVIEVKTWDEIVVYN